MKSLNIYLERPWTKNYVEGVSRDIEIPMISIPKMIEESINRFSDKIAVIFFGREISYRELLGYIKRFANVLKDYGLKKGDTLAIHLPNCPQFLIAYHAALRLGVKVVSVSPLYKQDEIRFVVSDSEATAIITLDIFYNDVAGAVKDTGIKHIIVTNIGDFLPSIKGFLGKLFKKIPSAKVPPNIPKFKELLANYPPLEYIEDIDPTDDLAVLLYTGGTTGPPKGVMLSHYNLVSNTHQLSEWIKSIVVEGEERVIALLPFFHVYGQVVYLILGLKSGFTLIILPRFEVKGLLETITKYKATMFIGVPYIYNILATYPEIHKYNLRSLKFCVCAADTLHQEVVDRWRKNVSEVEIYEGYGLTEMSPAVMVNPIGGKNKIGSMGTPISNIDAAVVDPESLKPVAVGEVGELITKGPNMMLGYWKRPEENKNVFVKLGGDTWLRTGDMVRMDEEGYFYFIQRSKDMIKYKGYSVFPVEIEEVLYEHPAVNEAAVIGIPDPKVGEKILAIIVLNQGYQPDEVREDIIEWCKSKLAPYKIPREIRFVDSLPKSPVGKVLKRTLREEYAVAK